jgi:hypothetical protein
MRTAQDLLAERRALVEEQRRAPGKTERALLQFEIDSIDSMLKAMAAHTSAELWGGPE